MEYTESDLKSRIEAVIKTNGVGAITGKVTQDVLIDIIDSVVDWLGDTFDPTDILNAIQRLQGIETPVLSTELDENNSILIEHNLNTSLPFVQVFDSSNNIYSNINYMVTIVNANQYRITFAESANFTVKTKS